MHTNNGKTAENALNPSQLNRLAKKTLENSIGSIWISGEVSNVSANQNLHIYFSLKDAYASVNCAFFKNANFSNMRLKNGDNVLIYGQVSIFDKNGNYQVIVKRIEKSGIGDRAKAFAELKIQLESMGYFSPEKKKKIPNIINSLAIVTSQTSAAITDVLNVIKKRNPLLEVTIYHASVQGDYAVEEIIESLLRADINQHDVILLTRGGGSLDDLWVFNDISIAQTLFNLETPCVSAIGHERDTSISDLVADNFAITPTDAAQMLTPDLSQLKLRIQHNLKIMQQNIIALINNHSQQLDISLHQLEKLHPKNTIRIEQQHLINQSVHLYDLMENQLRQKHNEIAIKKSFLMHHDFNLNEKKSHIEHKLYHLENLIKTKLNSHNNHLVNTVEQLNNLNPLSILSRGYSVTLIHNNLEVITDSDQVKSGDMIKTKLNKGIIISKIMDKE